MQRRKFQYQRPKGFKGPLVVAAQPIIPPKKPSNKDPKKSWCGFTRSKGEPVPHDIRQAVLEAIGPGGPAIVEVAKELGVVPETISQWKRIAREKALKRAREADPLGTPSPIEEPPKVIRELTPEEVKRLASMPPGFRRAREEVLRGLRPQFPTRRTMREGMKAPYRPLRRFAKALENTSIIPKGLSQLSYTEQEEKRARALHLRDIKHGRQEKGDADPRWQAWYKGSLRYMLRPHGQNQAYQWIRRWQVENPGNPGPLLLNCHRRFGKTFLAYLLGSEYVVGHPRGRVRIYSPSKEQGVDISDDVWPDVLVDKPEDISWTNSDGDLKVVNPRWGKDNLEPSLIVHHGTEIRMGSRARGVGSNLIILDEAQEMMQIEKLMKRVIGWQLAKMSDSLVLILFTPPHRRHPLNEVYIPEAIAQKRYFEMPLTKDEDFSEAEIRSLEPIVGSRHSINFRIEGECQWELQDEDATLLIPEWGHYIRERQALGLPNDLIWVNEYQLPDHYYPIISMDWSGRNFTSALFQYWDWQRALWIVRGEIWGRGWLNTPALLSYLKKAAEQVFPKPPHEPIYIMDMTSAAQANDVRTLWKFPFITPDRSDVMACLAELNSIIARGELRIHRSCRALLHQLQFGSFRDSESKRYASDYRPVQTNLLGDLDALDALRYALKFILAYKKVDPRPRGGQQIGPNWYPDPEEAEEGEEMKLITVEEMK